MKAFVVLENDVSFYCVDSQFKKYMLRKCLELKIVEEISEANEEALLRDSITQFFMQFKASFDVLESSLHRPLQSMTSTDGGITVLRKFKDYLYIAHNGDGEETENILIRKIFVFQRIVGYLYGPVSGSIKPSNLEDRRKVWIKLSSLLTTYSKLYLRDQVFLLEALEPIHFGLQLVQEQCLKLVNNSLDSLTNGGVRNVVYAMLLVNTKLLAIKGRHSRMMTTADKMLITLLVAHEYYYSKYEDNEHSSSTNEDVFSSPPIDIMAEREQSAVPGSPPYQTPIATPGIPPGRTPQPDMPVTEEVQEESEDDSMLPGEEDGANFSDMEKRAGFTMKLKSAISQLRRAFVDDSNDANVQIIQQLAKKAKYVKEQVFLQPYPNIYLPNTLHCLEIHPGIVLVLVEESNSAQLAGIVCQTLNLFNSFLFPEKRSSSSQSGTGKALFDQLEDNIKRIGDMTRREIQETENRFLEQSHSNVQNNWANVKTAGLQAVLEDSRKDVEESQQRTRVTTIASNLVAQIHQLFKALFFIPKPQEYDTKQVVNRLISIWYPLCRDYGDFLSIKSDTNIPIISYSNRYPGLVHFIMVDRTHNEIIAPTVSKQGDTPLEYVNTVSNELNISPGTFLHQKVWNMVLRSQRYFMLGYTSQTWLDEYFFYSYYLWLSVPVGNREGFLPTK
ncbi:BLOC-3 complex member HPS1-like isoform X2 [Dysidea avara]|uniref:BLOC-3 complex member HPS1-like isoform X2 n=1 Tax=Dysidea avara TaxID=196820 RepID=UPI003331415E